MVTAASTVLDRPIAAAAPIVAPRAAERAQGGVLVLVAILLVALNLRAAVTSLGALLDEVNGGLGLTPALAGVITTLPALSFAAFGALTPRLTRRVGSTRLLLAAMALLAAGQAARALTDSPAVFVATSALALAGIAVSNILLPVVVREHFGEAREPNIGHLPIRLGTVTGLYTTAMIAGSSVAAAVSVPIAHAAGSWRAGIGVWTVMAALAIVPILALRRTPAGTRSATDGESAAADDPTRTRPVRPSRSRIGWALALFFGLQSFSGYAIMGWLPQIYRDAGFSAQTAGLLLAGVMAAGVPIALVMPAVAARHPDQRPLVVMLAAAMVAAYLGLALAPGAGAVAWTALLAVGQGAFPLALTMIGMRARTTAGTVALSAFAQSVGYVIAAFGPLAVGILYELSGGWAGSLGVLLVAVVIQAVAGVAVARPRMLEDSSAPRVDAG